MRWLRLVGSIKLQVCFAKEPYQRDYILQKRPIIISILLTIATPYHKCIICMYSLLHLECHFFILKSQLKFLFSRSLLPCSVEKRPRRLRLQIQIDCHSNCNRLCIQTRRRKCVIRIYINSNTCICIHSLKYLHSYTCICMHSWKHTHYLLLQVFNSAMYNKWYVYTTNNMYECVYVYISIRVWYVCTFKYICM